MSERPLKHHRLLLHACCGPCSLEPSRILKERGEDFDILYSNSNIGPEDEYARRLDTLRKWAQAEGIDVQASEYDHGRWVDSCRTPFETGEIPKEQRCRRCYRLRFEDAARYAKDNGYETLCTTLSVSPYQDTDAIREELERACKEKGIECLFEDFRPYYRQATQRSREKGMYRQNYCGCELSKAEAALEREERLREKELKRARRMEENRAKLEEDKAKRESRRLYDEERARRKAILRGLRAKGEKRAD